jgi:sugar O-acyltransferase (sialic acid O-acetyltransferase NeuD family)
MNKILAIIGAGDLGRQIAYHAMHDNHFNTVIFFDDFNQDKLVDGFKLLGKTEAVLDSYNQGLFTDLIIGIGYKHMQERSNLFNRFKDKIPFVNIIHSSCIVDSSVKLGKGIVMYPGSIIDANVVIGDNVLINIGCVIAHDTNINSNCFLSPSVNLAGFVNVGEKSILGINCTVIDNIKIHSNTQIGGGGVVIKNINKNGLYVGNPVRFIDKNNI